MSPDASPVRRKLLHVFSTFGVGGPQSRAAQLIRALDRSTGHLLLAADGQLHGIEALGLIQRVRALPYAFTKGRGVALRNLTLMHALLRQERPDLLLTYNFGAIEAALAHRLWPTCPHLHFEDGFGPDEATGHQLARRVWLRRIALSGRSKIVVPSRTLERIARRRWRFSAERVEYLPNGVDVERFTPKMHCAMAAGGLRLGTVSTLRPEKNVARLLRAVAALPETIVARLVIAGDGPERPALTALVDRLGITSRVDFVGHVARPEALLRTLDLFALSSDTEQMPLSLLEAMATGLPVVATDVGDVRAMLPEAQHPLVVARDDEGAFAAGVATLACDRDLAVRLGIANREHACAHYGEGAMIRRYAQLMGIPSALPALAALPAG